ncbi:MAG TPA: VWA domain-containing protein [Phycisphaerales bacterium]|nr:VWA domain-containing protein [Phycisphaerales bacterium]HMP38082.1 VWA domain-containing protein [Phycisphaerales bacterium]
MSLTFANPAMLHGLWVVAALALLAAMRLRGGISALRRFAEPRLLPGLVPGFSTARAWLRLLLTVAAMALVVVALADPRLGVTTIETKRRGLDVVFALDVSRSMLAEDVRPNRLERAKLFIRDVVERLPGERVGLVAFAGDAVIACPLTLNHDTFRNILDATDIRDARRGGSSLAEALLAAGDSFADAAPEGKVIVLIGDGEDHEEDGPRIAALVRRERGARIFTVGIGDSGEGARIPVGQGARRGWLMHEGREVWTRMEPARLEAIATAGEGSFIPMGTATADVSRILVRDILETERKAMEGATVLQRIPRFQWIALPALALLVIESLVAPRRGAQRRRIDGS